MGPARSACSGPQKNSSPSANADRGFARTSDVVTDTLHHNLQANTALTVSATEVAVSGRMEGPGLFEMLQLLGREKTVARLRRAADTIRS